MPVFFAGNLRRFNSILLRVDSENKLAPRFSAVKPRVRRTGNWGTRVDADIFVIHRVLPPTGGLDRNSLPPSRPPWLAPHDVPCSYRSRIYNRPNPLSVKRPQRSPQRGIVVNNEQASVFVYSGGTQRARPLASLPPVPTATRHFPSMADGELRYSRSFPLFTRPQLAGPRASILRTRVGLIIQLNETYRWERARRVRKGYGDVSSSSPGIKA